MDKQACKLVSFNCKSFKRSVDGVREICLFADVVALQETWLLPCDLPMLGIGKSAIDPFDGILIGRMLSIAVELQAICEGSTILMISCTADRISVSDRPSRTEYPITFTVRPPNDPSHLAQDFLFH
ncbi:unnamed protein product [Leptidea sinapis]|uniref:Endonuclease/exonuclease/phosphatase domain-containing protein n=1 Tax=Leptidea sinapis TaxID=189913 RepID=A0A5E4Q0M0_9NEOP|nr:unnamed protein product [Leptidea sinapis]